MISLEIRKQIKRVNDLVREHGTLTALIKTMDKYEKEHPYDKRYYANVKNKIGQIENTLDLLFSKK